LKTTADYRVDQAPRGPAAGRPVDGDKGFPLEVVKEGLACARVAVGRTDRQRLCRLRPELGRLAGILAGHVVSPPATGREMFRALIVGRYFLRAPFGKSSKYKGRQAK